MVVDVLGQAGEELGETGSSPGVTWSLQCSVGHMWMGHWWSLLVSSINIFSTSSSDTAKEKDVFLSLKLPNLKSTCGYVSRVFPQVFLWLNLLQISACCTFIMKRIFSPPTKELVGNTCQNQKDHDDASGLALMYRKTLHNPSASIFACTLAMAGFLLFLLSPSWFVLQQQ